MNKQLKITTVCAWCKRIMVGGEWVEATDNPGLMSHGMCSNCYEENNNGD